jgi:hypothetical protein
MGPNILALLAALPLCISAAPSLLPRQSSSDTATVDLTSGARRGAPQNLAAGVLYGIPDDPTQIPDHFYSDMGFNYARIGGAQLEAGGWVDGLETYYARFNNTRDNYFQARKFGAKVIILPHDIWGTDHANESSNWPGDNGDWTDYDNYLNQLIGDLKANDMLDGLVYDTWNEPDGSFWERSQAQYLDLWSRTYNRIRGDSDLAGVLISGPSYAGAPNSGNNWWTNWAQRIVNDNTIPDQYTWHDEPGDVAVDVPRWADIRQQYNLPDREININEYATFDQQVSAGAAWWISRLERYNLRGLRGNWLSGWQLRDFLASLLTKTDTNDYTGTGYAGNGEYNVYKYYHQNMTGERATTTSTGDGTMDVFTTIGTDKVRVLTGVLNQQGTWYITISGLSGVGLSASGTLNIHTWGFDDAGHFGAVAEPSDRGVYGHQYSGDSVTFPVFQTQQDEHTAWAFEFDI